jgi:DNA mismatch repair protein MutS2
LRRELEAERERLERERDALATEHAAAMERVQETLLAERRQASERLEAAIRSLGREVEREVARIEDARERARVRARAEQAAQRARREAIPSSPAAGDAAPRSLDRPLAPGLVVRVVSLGRDGVVERVEGGSVVVRIGALPVTVRSADLAQPEGGGGRAAGKGSRFSPPFRSAAADDLGETASELRLIGKTVEEALPELDKFLDEAALAGRQELRVIHGHGTGRLRRAVRQFLARHVHVSAHRPGAPNEGGDGATIVTLK